LESKTLLTGISGLILVFGLALIGCDNGSTDNSSSNPLEGAWSYLNQGQLNMSLTFSGSTYTWKDTNFGALTTYEEGTYSVSNDNLLFQPTRQRGDNGNLVDVPNARLIIHVFSIVGNNLLFDGMTYTK
jgi:hypothetical protein